jgi:ribosome-associated protein
VTASARSVALAEAAASAAADKLASDLVILDVSDQLVITDCFVLASAPNDRQVKAVVDAVEERLLREGVKPVRREGEREGRWVLLDFVDVVVHVQHSEERTYYALERLWKDCPTLPLPADALPPAQRPGPPAAPGPDGRGGDAGTAPA